MKLLQKIKKYIFVKLLQKHKYDSDTYIKFLKLNGITIGNNVKFSQMDNITIDISRPSLVEIGNNIRFTRGFTLLTHDFSWFVLRNIYNEVIGCSGKVKIGNNIFFGFNVTVMPGVEIGDNCIIGTGSVVTKSIPSNSVAAGSPAKVLCTITEYYEKRKRVYVEEAIDYCNSIVEVAGRTPQLADFSEEFPLFIDSRNLSDFSINVMRKQLFTSFSYFEDKHISKFRSLEEFVEYAKKNKKH